MIPLFFSTFFIHSLSCFTSMQLVKHYKIHRTSIVLLSSIYSLPEGLVARKFARVFHLVSDVSPDAVVLSISLHPNQMSAETAPTHPPLHCDRCALSLHIRN